MAEKKSQGTKVKTEQLKKSKRFYLKGIKPADEVVKIFLRDSNRVSHGAKSINKQLPKWLHKPTEDWDIFSSSPEKDARNLEKNLDKKYGNDYFSVKPALHPGTFKVIMKETNREIADLTLIPEGGIEIKEIKGIKYASLAYTKKHNLETLKNPEASFRHAKDREVIKRINVAGLGETRQKPVAPKTITRITPKPPRIK